MRYLQDASQKINQVAVDRKPIGEKEAAALKVGQL